ncbi:MAG TPA: hypothetical protein VGD46_00525 [Rhizobacter sp.]
MAATSLKAVLVKHKPEKGNDGVIKRLLHSLVGGFELPRSKKTIHASELTKQEVEFCPRKYILLDEYDVKEKTAHIDTAQEITYAEGRMKQALFNEVWLRDRMWGGWRCRACKKAVEFDSYAGAMAKLNTSKDHTCILEYVEMRCTDPVAGHSGGIDALVRTREGEKLRLVECKIMGTDQFKGLKGPLGEHKARTQLYLRTLAKSTQPWAKQVSTEEASVLYMMRGHGMKDENGDMSPFKEYTVRRDHKGVAEYVARAHAVTLARREPERGAPCGVCKTMMTPQAQACPVAKQCFGSKHPATITWMRDGKPAHTLPSIEWIADGSQVLPRQD